MVLGILPTLHNPSIVAGLFGLMITFAIPTILKTELDKSVMQLSLQYLRVDGRQGAY